MAKGSDKFIAWMVWFDAQSDEDKRTIALNAIERLIQCEEVSFRDCEDAFEGEECKPCLFWDSCGEDLRIPF